MTTITEQRTNSEIFLCNDRGDTAIIYFIQRLTSSHAAFGSDQTESHFVRNGYRLVMPNNTTKYPKTLREAKALARKALEA